MTTFDHAVPSAGPRAASASTPSRQATTSRLRRTSQVILVLGTVLAVGAAFGPTWLVRVGVAVAVTAAVLACVFAWRELFGARRAHAADLLRASQQHGHALREERTRNFGVVDSLTRRVSEAAVVVEGQRTVIATLRTEVDGQTTVISTLRTEVAGLRGEGDALRAELAQRDTSITSLRQTVSTHQSELAALRAAQESEAEESEAEEGADLTGGDLHHMPRRVLVAYESTWSELPEADELWRDGAHPSVVDLRMVDTAMVLPNYEVDRRVG